MLTIGIKIMHEIHGKLSCALAIPLSTLRIKVTCQFRVKKLQELYGERTGVIIHLMMTLGPIITPPASNMERIQMIHISLDAGKRVWRTVLSKSQVGKHAEP